MTRINETKKLLDELDIKYEEKNGLLVGLWRTDKWENLVVNFIFSPNDVWLTIVGWRKFPKLNKKDTLHFYKKMLQESWSYNGVKFTLDPEGDIAVAVETADTDLTSEELLRYIGQVLNAADDLFDWVPVSAWKE